MIMPGAKRRKKAKKPLKFKVIAFKLTARQKKSLSNYAKSRNTTTTKLIKRAIRPLLDNYADLEFPDRPKGDAVFGEQLELF